MAPLNPNQRGHMAKTEKDKPCTKRIGVLSDLHVGSVFGLLPPKFITSDGHEATPNIGQKYLWECWKNAAEEMCPLDALIVNGDAIDGFQHAQRGTELCLPMIEDQSEAAYLCLEFFRNNTDFPTIFCIAGTEYHDDKSGREMEIVAQRLGAQRYSGLGTGRYCHEVLDLEIDGVIINFSHGISIASGLYRATPPDREAVWSALAGKAGKAPKADCLIRSHAHNFVHVEHASKHAVITPCWQLQTRYMRRHSAYRMIPDIGYTVITINGADKRKGADPCRIEKKIYPLPEIKTTKL